MVHLLFAVPLSKNWLGIHYWKATPQEDLPVELEYLPYEDFKDRFKQLSLIARLDYPTYWPNVAAFLVLAGISAAVTWGITKSGYNMGTMAQGAFFILPILIVIWIKIRKETKAKARKRFKHRSQKLLRVWTNEDVASHAIQWKLRLRSKTAAQRWVSGQTAQAMPAFRVEDLVQTDQYVMPQGTDQSTETTQQQQQQEIQEILHEHQDQATHQHLGVHAPSSVSEQLPATFSSSAPPPPPPPQPRLRITTPTISQVYNTLRVNSQRQSIGSRRESVISASSPPRSPTQEDGGSNEPAPRSRYPIWTSFVELFKGIWCCVCFFEEPKYWLIEISVRDCQVDEYALMVPSPVYCDYRLPGYEDVVGVREGSGNGTSPLANSSRAGSRVALHRYIGMPPAYESGSEDEEDEGDEDREGRDGDGDGDGDGGQDSSTRGEVVVVISQPEDPTGSSASSPEFTSNSASPPMATVRPSELAAAVLRPSSEGRSQEQPAQTISANSSSTSLSLDPKSSLMP